MPYNTGPHGSCVMRAPIGVSRDQGHISQMSAAKQSHTCTSGSRRFRAIQLYNVLHKRP